MFYWFLLLASVIFLDLILSGDNAVVIGMAAQHLDKEKRGVAITLGMSFAILMRLLFALFAVVLLNHQIFGFLGGLLLLYVAYSLGKDLMTDKKEEEEPPVAGYTLLRAVTLIALADISMSLDNILAVAALARNHPLIMVFGFFVSMLLLIPVARWVSDFMETHKWVNWVGLVLILWVAGDLLFANYDATLSLIRS